MLSKTKTFKNIVNYAFETIDSDKSGSIDKTELYAGLILIHLNLAAYVGPAACRPASKEYVNELFDMLDENHNGTLDKEEFLTIMTILCSQITTRVFIQLSMTLMIVPFISQYLVDSIKDIYWVVRVILVEIDDAEVVSEFIFGVVSHCWDVILLLTPPIIQGCLRSIYESLSESFVSTMPLTIMSCLLGCMIVPWLLFRCDEFYNSVASRRSDVKKVKSNVKPLY